MSAEAPFGSAKGLVLDHLVHGINHRSEPSMLLSPYVHLMQELVERHFPAPREPIAYFFAGGGAFTQPRAALALHAQDSVSVAELDPMVTAVVGNKLFVETSKMNVVHGDARTTLAQAEEASFDVVVTDLVMPELGGMEILAHAKKFLPDCEVIVEWCDETLCLRLVPELYVTKIT